MSPRILFVEDNPADFELVMEAFAQIGYEVDCTCDSDGPAALARIEGGYDPALIVIDLNLPRVNGCELLTRFKAMERLQATPVVIATSSASATDRERCRGADAFFQKPSRWKECLAFVESLRDVIRSDRNLPMARDRDEPGRPLP